MIAADCDALQCDLAETYGIFDYRAVPVPTLAMLATGLRDNSRIKQKMSGEKISTELALLAGTVDRLSLLVWLATGGSNSGTAPPPSIFDALNGNLEHTVTKKDVRTFDNPIAFESTWASITGVRHGS